MAQNIAIERVDHIGTIGTGKISYRFADPPFWRPSGGPDSPEGITCSRPGRRGSLSLTSQQDIPISSSMPLRRLVFIQLTGNQFRNAVG
jgi:hypothetical protein